MRDLQPAVEGSRNGDAFGRVSRAGESPLQLLQCAFRLLQFLDEGVDGLLRPPLLLVSLLPAEQPLHGGGCEAEERVESGAHLGGNAAGRRRRRTHGHWSDVVARQSGAAKWRSGSDYIKFRKCLFLLLLRYRLTRQ